MESASARPDPRVAPLRRLPVLPLVVVLALVLGPGLGCVSALAGSPARYDYFARPDRFDAWSPKIAGWQRRERAQAEPAGAAAPPVAGGPERAGSRPGQDLRAKYRSFQAERKRALARELADWIQREAPDHYVPDGPVDHWATLEETLRSDGDDCDGLELLVFHGLRELGFSEDEVYRAIVVRPEDGQHHMVTFWFEDPSDPWVIDPTGAMIPEMRRMSDIPEWVPLKVFSDDAEFTVRRRATPPATALASQP